MKTVQPSSGPWWKYGHVWLVISGPAAVVAAGLATAWIAVTNPDPVLAGDYYKRGIDRGAAQQGGKDQAPAMQGRNHAATPARPR